MARYAFSDLHGRLDLFQKICKFIKPEDELYCLGDCGDRGPQPWETIKAVLTHPQVHYLKGNHEDMLVKAFYEYQEYECIGNAYDLLCFNGGRKTFEDLLKMERFYAADWAFKLAKLPTIKEIKNAKGDTIIMSHAGFTPGGTIPADHDLLWDRNHFYDPYPQECNNTVIIHGHTPISYMKLDRKININLETFAYSNGHKINIDNEAIRSGIAILIDLDTYEIHKIYGEEFDFILKK